MTTYYTTHTKVASLLQISDFSTSTTPTDMQVDEIINRKEDYIDEMTRHAWREKTVTNEHHELPKIYYKWTGTPIHLNHRKVKIFDSSSGDKLEIWNGSEWEDWLTTRTEGRGNDYWVDYDEGIIFVKFYSIKRHLQARITYRYGEDTVPGDIEDACTKLTAIDLLTAEERGIQMPEGTEGVSYSDKINRWKEDVEKILTRRAELYAGVL